MHTLLAICFNLLIHRALTQGYINFHQPLTALKADILIALPLPSSVSSAVEYTQTFQYAYMFVWSIGKHLIICVRISGVEIEAPKTASMFTFLLLKWMS